jgi:hypothetical protein
MNCAGALGLHFVHAQTGSSSQSEDINKPHRKTGRAYFMYH